MGGKGCLLLWLGSLPTPAGGGCLWAQRFAEATTILYRISLPFSWQKLVYLQPCQSSFSQEADILNSFKFYTSFNAQDTLKELLFFRKSRIFSVSSLLMLMHSFNSVKPDFPAVLHSRLQWGLEAMTSWSRTEVWHSRG